MQVYMIRRINELSKGGINPQFSRRTGKLWARGTLKTHIRGLDPPTNENGRRWRHNRTLEQLLAAAEYHYANCDIVIFDVETNHTVSVMPIVDCVYELFEELREND